MDKKLKAHWQVLSEEPPAHLGHFGWDGHYRHPNPKVKVKLKPGAFAMVDIFGRERDE